jgi:hypothetical protein
VGSWTGLLRTPGAGHPADRLAAPVGAGHDLQRGLANGKAATAGTATKLSVSVSDKATEEKTKTMDVATLADLLHETSEHHDLYEKTHPKHNWWDWYAAYLDARERGSSPEAAEKAAGLYMDKIFAAQG